MLTVILKIICYSFVGFILFCIFMVYGQFFTDPENLLFILLISIGIIAIRYALKYRQKHPYKPKLDKESWLIVFWVCIYKILTGKKR